MPDQTDEGLGAVRPDLEPAEDARSAFVTRFARRDVKLTAYTATEIQMVSFANTKITVYLSWAFFWFGVLANGLMMPKCPDLHWATVFYPPYLWGFAGLFGIIAALMEGQQKQSLYHQISTESKKESAG